MASSLRQQLELFNPVSEAELYHDIERPGFFALLIQQTLTTKKQYIHRLTDMVAVIDNVDCTRDTWLSQAEFYRPNRRVVNLSRVGLLFTDIDTYKLPWAQGRTPEQLAATIKYACREEGIPEPSLMVFSGRGIQAKWILERPLPRAALPRWNLCQNYLVDKLSNWGADSAAKDASRVLRLVNTVNTKSNEICRVVDVHEQNGQPVQYNFEYLAEMLLPVGRWEIEKQQRKKSARPKLQMLSGGLHSNLRSFRGNQLAWDRMNDLRRLIELRDGVKEGERMLFLFWVLNFLLLSGATNSTLMYYEAAALAKEIDPAWNCRSKELMTLYAKAKQYEAGEKVSFMGKDYAPLYTPKNDTLINIFRITPEEEKQLKTIVSRGESLERDRVRHEKKRRAAGMISRETYLNAALTKAEQAIVLKTKGLSVRQIAEEMGISKSAVGRYLQQKP